MRVRVCTLPLKRLHGARYLADPTQGLRAGIRCDISEWLTLTKL